MLSDGEESTHGPPVQSMTTATGIAFLALLYLLSGGWIVLGFLSLCMLITWAVLSGSKTSFIPLQHLVFQTAFQSVTDAVIAINESGIVLLANDACKELIGYRPVELIGESVNKLIPCPAKSIHDQYLKDYVATGVLNVTGHTREVVWMSVSFPST